MSKRRRVYQVLIRPTPEEMVGFNVANFALTLSDLERLAAAGKPIPPIQLAPLTKPAQPTQPGGNSSEPSLASRKTKPDKEFVYRIPNSVFKGVLDLCERHRSVTPIRLLGVLLEVWFEGYRCNPVRLTSCRLK
jgi:hypothetical protein